MKRNVSIDVANFDAEILNVALALSLEWGENWLAPINARIMAIYPTLSAEDAQKLDLWCKEVSNFAYALVEKDYPQNIAGEVGDAMQRVAHKYPQIEADNLARLYNQGMYYAWHG